MPHRPNQDRVVKLQQQSGNRWVKLETLICGPRLRTPERQGRTQARERRTQERQR